MCVRCSEVDWTMREVQCSSWCVYGVEKWTVSCGMCIAVVSVYGVVKETGHCAMCSAVVGVCVV